MLDFNKIDAGLTNELSHDVPYLIAMLEETNDPNDFIDLKLHVHKIIFSMWPIMKEPLKRHDHSPSYLRYKNVVFDISNRIKELRFKEAKLLLNPMINNLLAIEEFKQTNDARIYSFNNNIEFYLYTHMFIHKEEVLRSSVPSAQIFNVKGFLSFCQNDSKTQLEMLKHSLEWNPMDMEVLNDYIHFLFNKKIDDRLLQNCILMWKCSYTKKDLANAYKNLGNYYFIIEEYEIALYLFELSKHYYVEQYTEDFIDYIKQQRKEHKIEFDKSKFKFHYIRNYVLNVGFDLVPNKQIIQSLEYLIDDLSDHKLIQEALYIHNIIEDLNS